MARQSADDAYDIARAREQGKHDARREDRLRRAAENGAKSSSGALGGCVGCAAVLVGLAVAVFVAWGLGGGKADRPADAGPVAAVPSATPKLPQAGPAKIDRHAAANTQVSRIGVMEADIVSAVSWVAHDDDNLMLIGHLRGVPDGESVAAAWYSGAESPATMVAESSGQKCRQVTTSVAIKAVSPEGSEFAVMFEMARGDRGAYLIELPLTVGGKRVAFRFRVSASARYDQRAEVVAGREIHPPQMLPPFQRSLAPLDAESRDTVMSLGLAVAAEKDAPRPDTTPKPKVGETIPNATVAATAKRPTVCGVKLAKYVAQYERLAESANAKAAAKMLTDGEVVMLAEPVAVRTEGGPAGGYVYFRPTEGLHKGKLLIVREADIEAAR